MLETLSLRLEARQYHPFLLNIILEFWPVLKRKRKRKRKLET